MKTANRKKGPDTVFENYLNVELQSAFWQSQAVRAGPDVAPLLLQALYSFMQKNFWLN
jgi:hypothetical protein